MATAACSPRARARATSSSLQRRSTSVSTSTMTPNDWSPKTSGTLRYARSPYLSMIARVGPASSGSEYSCWTTCFASRKARSSGSSASENVLCMLSGSGRSVCRCQNATGVTVFAAASYSWIWHCSAPSASAVVRATMARTSSSSTLVLIARGFEEQTELTVLPLGLLEQLRVMDGRRRLLSQGGGHLALFPGEVALRLGLDEHQQPHRFALVDERHVEERLLAVVDHPLPVALVQRGIRHVLLHDLAAQQHLPVRREVGQLVGAAEVLLPARLGLPRVVGDDRDGVVFGVVGVDGRFGGVERLARGAGDRGEQLVEANSGVHGPAGHEPVSYTHLTLPT